MASVIASARNSGVSAFDLVTKTFAAGTQLVDTASRSIDMLDAKARALHASVIADAEYDMINVEEEAETRAAARYYDFQSEIARKYRKTEDDSKAFDAALELIRKRRAALGKS